MIADDVQTAIFIATFGALALRFFAGLVYPWRQHRVWTFGLSLAAWMALYLRLIVTREFALIAPLDPIATVVWLGPLVTQIVAIVYLWWPNRRRR